MAARAKKAAAPRGLTAAQLYGAIAERTGHSKAQVKDVFTALDAVIAAELKGGRPVKFNGIKITRTRKEARPARQGRNPSTGEPMMFKAKPACWAVKVRALKTLKDCV